MHCGILCCRGAVPYSFRKRIKDTVTLTAHILQYHSKLESDLGHFYIKLCFRQPCLCSRSKLGLALLIRAPRRISRMRRSPAQWSICPRTRFCKNSTSTSETYMLVESNETEMCEVFFKATNRLHEGIIIELTLRMECIDM